MKSAFKYQMKAARCYGRGDYNGAIDHCKRMIEIEGKNAYSLSLMALCQEQNEKYSEAIKSAEQALECDENHFESYELLSRIYFNRNDYEKTKLFVIRGLESYPEPLPKPPRFLFGMLKLLSIIPKFKHVYEGAEEEISNPNRSNEKWFQWAKEFLDWYEKSNGQKSGPTVH